MRNSKIKFMSDIARDIIQSLDHREDITSKEALKRFYALMLKHGIKQHTWNKNGNGATGNNPEWTMCLTLFMKRFKDNRDLYVAFGGGKECPKELYAYGKQPKSKRNNKLK